MINKHQWRVVGEETWHSLYDGLWQEGHGELYWGGRKVTSSFEGICAQCQKKLASSDSVVHYTFSPSKKEDGRFYCWEHSPVPIELRNPEVTYRGVLRLDE